MNFDSVFASVCSFQANNALKTEVRRTKASQKSTKMTKAVSNGAQPGLRNGKLYVSWSHGPTSTRKTLQTTFWDRLQALQLPSGGAPQLPLVRAW